MTAQNKPDRKDLAKIHIAKKALGIEDEDYRAILKVRYGKSSAAKLTRQQGWDLIAHFKKMGWRARPAGSGSSGRTVAPSSDKQSRMIRGLWITLAHAGVVHNPSESALNKFCKRMVGVDALRFANTRMKSNLIENLKKWQRRDLASTIGGLLLLWDMLPIGIPGRKGEIEWRKKNS